MNRLAFHNGSTFFLGIRPFIIWQAGDLKGIQMREFWSWLLTDRKGPICLTALSLHPFFCQRTPLHWLCRWSVCGSICLRCSMPHGLLWKSKHSSCLLNTDAPDDLQGGLVCEREEVEELFEREPVGVIVFIKERWAFEKVLGGWNAGNLRGIQFNRTSSIKHLDLSIHPSIHQLSKFGKTNFVYGHADHVCFFFCFLQ